MTNTKNTIEKIVGLISVIIGLHYFLSFRWFYSMSKLWGTENLSIISFDDLALPFANLNITVISLSILSYIVVELIKFKPISKSKKNGIVSSYYFFLDWFDKNSKKNKVALLVFLILLFFTIYLFILVPLKTYSPSIFLIFVITVLILVLYEITEKDKHNFILGIHLMLIFCWANFLVNEVIKKASEKDYQNETQISFVYKNKIVKTSDSLKFVFHGNKFLILSKNDKLELYDTKNIDKIVFKGRVNKKDSIKISK